MYETDPQKLLLLSPDEWDELLASVLGAPVPRRIVRIVDASVMDSPKPVRGNRRQFILDQLEAGKTKADCARLLDVSPGLISKILKGERN